MSGNRSTFFAVLLLITLGGLMVIGILYGSRMISFLESLPLGGKPIPEILGGEDGVAAPLPSPVPAPKTSRRALDSLDHREEGGDEDVQTTPTLSPALLTTATLHAAVPAAPEPGEITGTIENTEASAITGAKVTLLAQKEGTNEAPPEENAPPEKLPEAVSGVDGTYRLRKVPAGEWTVVVTHTAYATTHRPHVRVRPGKETSKINLTMPPGLELTGNVRDPAGQGLTGARIEARRRIIVLGSRDTPPQVMDYQYREALAGEEGTFTLEHIATGENVLTTSLAGYAPDQRSYHLAGKDSSPKIEIVLRPAGAIGGRVIGPTRNPVSGAVVKAFTARSQSISQSPSPAAADSDPKPSAEGRSDAGGAFLLGGLRDDHLYDLQFEAEGLAIGWLLDVKANTFQNQITLDAGGSISGLVTALGGKNPVSGVRLVALQLDGPVGVLARAGSGSDGVYQIDRLPAGNYEVLVASGRWVAEPRRPVAVKTGQTTGGQNFVVYEGIRVTGTVVDVQNGARIAGAEVRAEGLVGGDLTTTQKASIYANDSGEFVFPGLPEGVYLVTASASGYESPDEDFRKARVEVSAGITPFPVEVALRRGGTVTGSIEGIPPEYFTKTEVIVHQPPGSVPALRRRFRVSCDADGYFEINGIPIHQAVSFQLLATANNQAYGQTPTLLLTPHNPSMDVRIVLEAGAAIEGTVMDPQRRPLQDAEVILEPDLGGGILKSDSWKTTSDEAGRFRLEQLPLGVGRLRAIAEFYQPVRQKLLIARDSELEPVTIIRQPGGVISGLVVDDFGYPLEGARVGCSAANRGQYRATEVKLDAEYILKGVVPGDNTISVRHSRKTPYGTLNYHMQREGVRPDTNRCDFVFPINAQLAGRVISKTTNRPIERFSVAVRIQVEEGMGASGGFSFSTNITATTGAFFLSHIPGGKGEVTIRAGGHLPWTKTDLEFSSPDPLDLGVVDLTQAGTIPLLVVSSRTGEPIAGASARWLPSGPSARSDSRGRVVIQGISAGVSRILVDHAHYRPKETGVVQVTPGRETKELRVELDPGAMLSGVISAPSGQPIPGVRVVFTDRDGTEFEKHSDNAGHYLFDGLLPGGGLLRVEKSTSQGVAQAARKVLLHADESTFEDFELDAIASVRGTLISPPAVYPDYPGGSVQVLLLDPDGRPAGFNPIAGSVDADGDFSVGNLNPGVYLVLGNWRILSSDHPLVPARVYPWAVADLRRGPVTRCDLYVPLSSVSGTITAADTNSPVPRVSVTLALLDSPLLGDTKRKAWWEWTVRSDSRGKFNIGGLGPGIHRLTHSAMTAGDQPVYLPYGVGSENKDLSLTISGASATK
jgi:hypothetical protein